MRKASALVRVATLICSMLAVVSCKPYFTTEFCASDGSTRAFTPALAAARTGFGIAWMEYVSDCGAIRLAEYDLGGSTQGTAFPLDLAGGNPALAFSGSSYGLSYRSTNGEYRLLTVGLDGSTTSEITVPGDACDGAPLVWNGSAYRIAYRVLGGGLYTASIDADGSALSGETLVADTTASPSYEGSLVCAGTGYGLAWVSSADGTDDVELSVLDADAGVLVTSELTQDAAASEPSVAWSGSEFGLVWSAPVDECSQVFFGRAGADGSPLGAAVQLTSGSSAACEPKIVWGPEEYGVSWSQDSQEGMNIRFVRLYPEGDVIEESSQLSTAAISGSPSLIWHEGEYVCAWSESPEASEGYIDTGTAGSPIREIHVSYSLTPPPTP